MNEMEIVAAELAATLNKTNKYSDYIFKRASFLLIVFFPFI